MANVVSDSLGIYRDNIRLILLFSIPFLIAFLIPLLAPLPTYISTGAIFLRTASIFVNTNPVVLAVVTISTFVSMLFISFAFVAISLIVKSDKTHMATSKRVMLEIERYISRVFTILLFYAFIVIILNISSYLFSFPVIWAEALNLIIFLLIFYMPTAMVIDDKRFFASLKGSIRLVVTSPKYVVLWLVLFAAATSAVDLIFSGVLGVAGSYVTLVVNSVFILPYFVIFIAEAYIRRFPLLRH